MKKILILSLSAGAGHIRAAEALVKTAELYYPDAITRHLDTIEYVSKPIKSLIVESYSSLVKKTPGIWGYLYKKTNQPRLAHQFNGFSDLINRINPKRLAEAVLEFQPDAIISTHAFPPKLVAGFREKNLKSIKQSVVITDYGLHSFWITPEISQYFVATEEMKRVLEANTTNAETTVSGIPVDPIFYTANNIDKLKNKHNIPKEKKVLLVLAGGFGLTNIDKTIRKLLRAKEPLCIIAIAGKNDKLVQNLKKIVAPAMIDLNILGWTSEIDEYLRMADIVITKAGGLTTSECLALKKPMIIVDPIPGQEEANAIFVEKYGYGKVVSSLEQIPAYAGQLPETLAPGYARLKNQIKQKTPAEIILETVLKTID